MKKMWLIWLLLIILITFMFPKDCGQKEGESDIFYKCIGLNLPFESTSASGKKISWCSGFCMTKDIERKRTNDSVSDFSDSPDFLNGMMESFLKAIPLLLGIMILAGIVAWIGSLSKKGGRTEVRVYRN
jgi:hypothetical protein